MKTIADRKKFIVFLLLASAFLGYSFFLYARPPVANSFSTKTAKGKEVWQKYNCSACHQVYGLGGFLGPDLTNVYAKGPGYITSFLLSGTRVMPNFELSKQEVEDLLDYFQHLDGSGKSDPRTFKILPDGSIEQ